jgi:hypothetical protein
MNPILSMSMWVSLSNEQRNRIRVLFKIPRSRNTEVNDGRIVSDGTTPEDFKALSIEKMQEYLSDNSSTDFHKLFDRVIAKVQDEIEGKPVVVAPVVQPVQVASVVVPETPKKRGRPAKKNA